MIRLHHEAARVKLREVWPEVRAGIEAIADVMAEEAAGMAAEAVPTRVFDSLAREQAASAVRRRFVDLLAYLESQRERG